MMNFEKMTKEELENWLNDFHNWLEGIEEDLHRLEDEYDELYK